MSIFTQLKNLISPPIVPTPCPYKVATKSPTPTPPEVEEEVEEPGKIEDDKQLGIVRRIERHDGFEVKVVRYEEEDKKKKSARNPNMTPVDFQILRERPKLCPIKYRKLKPYWADNMSAAKIAQRFRSVDGYSQRLIDNFVSAFNESRRRQTTTPAQNRGSDVKHPHKAATTA